LEPFDLAAAFHWDPTTPVGLRRDNNMLKSKKHTVASTYFSSSSIHIQEGCGMDLHAHTSPGIFEKAEHINIVL
jgi:hypothetical protein